MFTNKRIAMGVLAMIFSVCVHAEVNDQAVVEPNTCQLPQYPKASLAREEQGKVTMHYRIAVDGSVLESKLLKSSGFPLLDTAAVNALALCKFKPKTVDGKPVESWMVMHYVWTLG
jgi:TonB family protein